MSRHSLLAIVAASVLLSGAPAVQAEDPPPEAPRATCKRRLIDNASNDGFINPAQNSSANRAELAAAGLDIESMFLRSTSNRFGVFLKINDIPERSAMAPRDPGYLYQFALTAGAKKMTYSYYFRNGQPPYNEFGPVSGVPRSVFSPERSDVAFTPAASDKLMPVQAAVDPATNYLYALWDRQALAERLGVTLAAGEKIEVGKVASFWYADTTNGTFASDELVPTDASAKTWTVDDNYCFGLPPASVSDIAGTATQFSDDTTLTAKVIDDEAGTPLANQPVSFTVGSGSPLAGTTDANGVATALYTASLPAGKHAIRVTFAGSDTVGAATGVGELVIAVEGTKMLPLAVKRTSATVRTVTATLQDDDGKVLPGQKLTWYVNGKKVTTTTTDRTGKSIFKAKPTQKVQARFLGVPAKYATSVSNIAKV